MYLIILFLIVYAVLAWRRLDWSVMLFLLALPSYQVRFNVFGIPTNLLEAIIGVSFLVWFLRNYKQICINVKSRFANSKFQISNFQFQRYPFDIEIVLLLIIAFIAIAVAGFTDSAFGIFKSYFFVPILVFILLFNVFKRETKTAENALPEHRFNLDKIIWPLTISAFLVSVYAVLQRFGILYSPENFWPRVTGVFFYPNALGLYLGPMVPIMIVSLIFNFQFSISKQFLISKFSIFKLGFQFFVIVLSIAAIFFARSEGALIGLLLAFSFMFLFWVFLRFDFRLVYLKLIAFLVFVFVLLSPFVYLKLIPEHKYFNFESPVLNYVTDKTMLKDFSGEVRKQQWRETMEFLTASPKNFIFGAGLSGFQSAVEPYHSEGIFFNSERDEDFRRKIVLFDENYKAAHWRPVEIYMYPHSLVLNFWVELGFAGMLLFVWILLKIYRLGIMNNELRIMNNGINYMVVGLVGAFVVIIVHGLVDVPYFKNDLAVLFWVMVAMLGMLCIGNKKTALISGDKDKQIKKD